MIYSNIFVLDMNESMAVLIEQDLELLDNMSDSIFLPPMSDIDITTNFVLEPAEPFFEVLQPVEPSSDVLQPVEPSSDVLQPVEPSSDIQQPVLHVLQPVQPYHEFLQPAEPCQQAEPGPSSGRRAIERPPRQHNMYSSVDSDIMIDSYGLPIASRTRSQSSMSSMSNISSSTSTQRKTSVGRSCA